MSVTQQQPAVTTPPTPAPGPGSGPWWRLDLVWGAVSIVVMWLAVIVVGVNGSDMTFRGADTSSSTIPVVAVIAICAALATAAIARRVFRH